MSAPLLEASSEPSWIAATISKVRSKVNGTRDDLEQRRSSSRLIDTVFGSIEYESKVGGGLLAGAVAFRFFLVLVPYVFVLVLGFGVGADLAAQDPQDLARKFGIAGLAATAIQAGAAASTWARVVTLCIALYALVIGAHNLVKALRTVHALIWRVRPTKMRRPLIAPFAFIGALTVALMLESVIAEFRSISVAAWILSVVLFAALPAGAWLLCMVKLFPSAPGVTWRQQWAGAALMGVGAELLHIVTIYWIARSLESKSSTYGALGAALTILLWAYMLGRLVTAAASLNVALWDRLEPD
jgi:uncharacterized BrkB/YihY/UPF0761 family membrane protein